MKDDVILLLADELQKAQRRIYEVEQFCEKLLIILAQYVGQEEIEKLRKETN